MDRLLYFYTNPSTFVSKDLEIVRLKYEVVPFHFNVQQKSRLINTSFSQLFFLLWHIWRARIMVCQFAGVHSFLPVLFGKIFFKPCVVVAGGTDCVGFPAIRYGNFTGGVNEWATRFSYRFCRMILPVHKTLEFYPYNYDETGHRAQGIRYFMPQLKTEIRIIHNGYDPHYWFRRTEKEPRTLVTAIAQYNPRFTMQLKGLDMFLELAAAMPDHRFLLAGGQSIRGLEVPFNVELLPNIWGDKLVELYARCEYYVQLSMSEGFPNGLTEAMLCECVPIVSAVGGMPDIVQDLGLVLPRRQVQEIIEKTKAFIGVADTRSMGKAARESVIRRYTFEKRAVELLQALKEAQD